MTSRREIKVGAAYPQVKPGRRKFRRVIALKDGIVFYSSGGDKNYFCSEKAFMRQTKPEPLSDDGSMLQLSV